MKIKLEDRVRVVRGDHIGNPIINKNYKPDRGYNPRLIQMKCQLCKAIFL
jgi:hypothetical protein